MEENGGGREGETEWLANNNGDKIRYMHMRIGGSTNSTQPAGSGSQALLLKMFLEQTFPVIRKTYQ